MSSNMQYKGNNFCTEPYRTVCIGTTGGVSPCCALSHKSFGLVTEDSANSINDVYDSKYWKRFFKNNAAGNFDNDCLSRCDRQGITTFKQSWQIAENENWKHRNKTPVSADIAFGNLCNLSCTMCSSVFSSEWIKIDKKEKGYSDNKPWNFSITQVKELAKYIKDVNRIVIKGGEPMYNPRFPLFLEELAKYKTEIDFTLITNLSVVQNDALEQIQKFKFGEQKPYIQASLESCDDNYYKMIRGGKDTTFETFAKNFKLIKENYSEISLRVAYLINAWSMHRIKEDIELLQDIGVEKIQMNTIFGPVEQSFTTQNYASRKKAKETLENIVNKYPKLIENHEIIHQFDIRDKSTNKDKNIDKTKAHFNRRLLQGVTFNNTFEEIFEEYINNHV
ncbi:radical SAM protein [archaeon]|nr:radical SAM protein [archaeon]